ncbi:TPA: hypothetical protein ACKSGG_000620 [Streptococcus pyogenes]|uniref:hypothetical protein n=1 Tax=Streptococcus pyogenes TaxID=1314 RepID=UPI002B369868|nr:hypothetical protein [Streptococcus pyogenes]
MIDYAIYYQQKGFSVIPISKDGKKPLVAFADKPAFTEHEFATKREAMQFIRKLELANEKRSTEYFMREAE